jgi:hypothetical protein
VEVEVGCSTEIAIANQIADPDENHLRVGFQEQSPTQALTKPMINVEQALYTFFMKSSSLDSILKVLAQKGNPSSSYSQHHRRTSSRC